MKNKVNDLISVLEVLMAKDTTQYLKSRLTELLGGHPKGDLKSTLLYRRVRIEDRKKAADWYWEIPDKKLKHELIKDMRNFLFARRTENERMAVLSMYYQMENMLNYYCEATNAWQHIEQNKEKYNYKNHHSEDNFEVNCYSNFFFKGSKKSISRVSFLGKLIYWVIHEDQKPWYGSYWYNIKGVATLRNAYSHKNSTLVNKEIASTRAKLLKDPIQPFQFVVKAVEKMKTTLSANEECKEKANTISRASGKIKYEKKEPGLNIVDKIPLDELERRSGRK